MKSVVNVIAWATLTVGVAGPAQAQFVWPTTGWIGSTYYTWRTGGFYHHGTDIMAPLGQRVVASHGGKILLRGWYSACSYYGNLVAVRHPGGYDTYYGHNSAFGPYGIGQAVNQNQTIAYIGSTGNSNGNHCHFEIRRFNTYIYSYSSQIYVPATAGGVVTAGRPIPYVYPGLTTPPPPGATGFPVAIRVNAGVTALNVRTGPGTGYSVLGRIDGGQAYVALASSNGGTTISAAGWGKIQYDHRTGWISGAYAARTTGVTVVTVTADAVNVRTGPGVGFAKIGQVSRGMRFVRIATSGGGSTGLTAGWHKIGWGGRAAWIIGSYVAATQMK